jgi:hypothetical protein
MSEPRYVRIYVIRPSGPERRWAVRVDSDEPTPFGSERDAMSHAIQQARARSEGGARVDLRMEDDLGHWRSMKL